MANRMIMWAEEWIKMKLYKTVDIVMIKYVYFGITFKQMH